MRIRARSIVLGLLFVIVMLVIGAITSVGWQIVLGPTMRPVTGRTFERTPARLARGQYLMSVAPCLDCHTDHDTFDT